MKAKVKNNNELNIEVIKHFNDPNRPDYMRSADERLYILHTGLYSKAAYNIMQFIAWLEEDHAFTMNYEGFFIRKPSAPNKRTAKNEKLYVPKESSFCFSDFIWYSRHQYFIDHAIRDDNNVVAAHLISKFLTQSNVIAKIFTKDDIWQVTCADCYNWMFYNITKNAITVDEVTGEILLKSVYREDFLKSGKIRYPEYFKTFNGYNKRIIKKCFDWITKNYNTLVENGELGPMLLRDHKFRCEDFAIKTLKKTVVGNAEMIDVVKIVEAQVFNDQCALRKMKAKVGKDTYDKIIGMPFNPISGESYKAAYKNYNDFLKYLYDLYKKFGYDAFKIPWSVEFPRLLEKHDEMLDMMEN